MYFHYADTATSHTLLGGNVVSSSGIRLEVRDGTFFSALTRVVKLDSRKERSGSVSNGHVNSCLGNF